ncbi:hypothetical protein JNB11_06430 [Kocuria palustris]|nr:hypothetical protein [Kocuria palustris]
MAHPFHKRLLKEYRDLSTAPPPGITLVEHDDSLERFVLRVLVPDNPLYPSHHAYHLLIRITPDYPVDLPQVTFIVYQQLDDDDDDDTTTTNKEARVPVHPHVYLNGHICLNLLGDDWTPACLLVLTAVLIQLMLASNHLRERPSDDDAYCRHAPHNPKLTLWAYHDDTV